ncbi:TlpA family protein disulfide reductase [Candidatus Altiarchaeota archaeon]
MAIALFLGCIEGSGIQGDETSSQAGKPSWMDETLTDAVTGETYKISDFRGKTILIETFAVWCPTCRRQQDEVRDLHDLLGDELASISLDTDPNEDIGQVRGHVERNRYDWRFSISPESLTKRLIDEFGVTVVNAPSTPVIIICPDGSRHLLGRGLKTSDKLAEEIGKRC